jgi:7-cyano-7-deazaguanine synthase
MRKGKGSRVRVLISGGIDSTLCIHLMQRAGYSVECLFIDYGQAARKQERQTVRRITSKMNVSFETVRVTASKRFFAGEHLGRNLFLISTGLLFETTPASALCIGIHAGSPYFDCSTPFFRRAARLTSELSSGRVALLAPLLSLNKTEIINLARKEGIPIHLTYSCERGTSPPCGRCSSCLDRKTHSV